MTEFPRRTLDEISFIYEHHPERKDVFVEGPFDASLLRWMLQEMDHRDVVVYEISGIDIPRDALLAMRPENNNRERLVFLSNVLMDSNATLALCIIDADFSLHSDDLPKISHLIWTEFPCMDAYLVNPKTLEKFFRLVCNRPSWSTEKALSNLLRVTRTLFYFRFADKALDLQMAWPNKISLMSIDNWEISFDSDEFRTRWLSSNALLAKVADFDGMVQTLRAKHSGEVDLEFNGHDFFRVFSWALRNSGMSTSKASIETVKNSLLMALETGEVRKLNLFKSIDNRFRAC